ncbi:hypothetical protein Ddye_011550 [Dipteronia dyeriana]|uniref:Uncharacterized protein n=1 Tax=Dipteronia dyeriana TaxID=168575 RepID=A0AAD9X2P6_9ROSI|nr:hypothetical protein Ddye_011550 [Dipteronia dyeriana]
MDPPVTVERLSQINQEILCIDNEKQQREQTMAALWEHLPPIDLEVVAKAMQELHNCIRALEDRNTSRITISHCGGSHKPPQGEWKQRGN